MKIIELLIQARKKDSDAAYRKWIQRQPSCISGRYDYTEIGDRCEAAHVRRAGASGMGFKAEYACVPLTHTEHAIQHSRGELALLQGISAGSWTRESAKAYFDRMRIRYLKMWLRS